jgi:hypothetical protein
MDVTILYKNGQLKKATQVQRSTYRGSLLTRCSPMLVKPPPASQPLVVKHDPSSDSGIHQCDTLQIGDQEFLTDEGDVWDLMEFTTSNENGQRQQQLLEDRYRGHERVEIG